jgi:NADH/NAD ratio-sensing transcriptional regulator Rex
MHRSNIKLVLVCIDDWVFALLSYVSPLKITQPKDIDNTSIQTELGKVPLADTSKLDGFIQTSANSARLSLVIHRLEQI